MRAVTEAGPLTATREVAEELSVDYSTVVWHLKQTGKVKKLHKLTEKKIIVFEMSSSLFFFTQQKEPLLDRIVTCDEKRIF